MASFEWALSWRATDQLSVGASAYTNRIDDKLAKELLPAGERWINHEELNSRGFELYGNCSLPNLQLYANYSYTDSYNRDNVSIAEISQHAANAGLTWRCCRMLLFHLRGNYLGARDNPFPIATTGSSTIDDFLIWHSALTFSCLKRTDLQLRVNNLLNEKYFHPSNLFAGRFRQPQRTVSLMLNYRF